MYSDRMIKISFYPDFADEKTDEKSKFFFKLFE